jgi:ubiquinone/menaquinone biosynthesis C-methylase UbiE
MTTMLNYSADNSRKLEAVYTTADVVAQRAAVLDTLAPRPGERVLDVGSGPGLLAAQLAAAVGPEGSVCGVDPSESMLAIAAAREPAAGSAPIELRRAAAERLPYPERTFDVAVSTQVLEYSNDVPGAIAEMFRVLRPGGRVLILDTDWDSIVWHSSDRGRMERVLAVWEQHLADPHLPRSLAGTLRDAGFEPARPQVLPLLNIGYEPATYSGGFIDIVEAFVADRDESADAKAWAEDLRALGERYFFSLNRYLFSAVRPG